METNMITRELAMTAMPVGRRNPSSTQLLGQSLEFGLKLTAMVGQANTEEQKHHFPQQTTWWAIIRSHLEKEPVIQD
jgi:hypothetical protein